LFKGLSGYFKIIYFFLRFNLNCQGYCKNDRAATGVPLQKFLRQDHQKTTEIYAGYIETGTIKQMDFLNNFWKGKLNETKGVAASISFVVISL
jgi:reverse gyrase